MLRLARIVIGIASSVAKVVPIAAIATVSAVRCASSGVSLRSGGQAPASQWPSLGNPVTSLCRSMPASSPRDDVKGKYGCADQPAANSAHREAAPSRLHLLKREFRRAGHPSRGSYALGLILPTAMPAFSIMA